MAQLRKEPPPEETNGAPMWMVTFSDCMNLLLTFFVLLVTFSSFGDDSRDRILNFGAAMRAVFGSPAPSSGEQDQSSVAPIRQSIVTEQPRQGSDKPTGSTPPIPREGVLNETIEAAEYRRHKVFLIPSRKVFLGRGAVLSPDGRYLLGVMAAFLNEVEGPVVLSENGPDPQPAGMQLGLARAMAVLQYFSGQQNLDRRRFSLSAESNAPPEDAAGSFRTYHRPERMLEIVLLEGSVQQ